MSEDVAADGNPQVGYLRLAAAVLASLVAGIHLLHPQLGAPRLIRYIQVGTLFDPRPLLFTLSGFLIVFGIVLVFNGLFVRQVYLFGVGLMVVYLLGFAAWHTVLDHGGFWPTLRASSDPSTGFLTNIWLHMTADMAEMVSILSELALVVLLVVLYRADVPERA